MIKKIQNNQNIYLVGLIILISLFFRFWHLNTNYIFGVDEEYQALLAQTLLKHLHILWIGVSISVGFYLGPLWTYLTYLLFLLSHGDPLITGYLAALIGVMTSVLIFFVGKKMFNTTTGFISALLYACLPLMVFYDQKYWNVTPVPFLSVALLFTIYQARKNQYWWILFSLLFGLVFHSHLILSFYIFIALYSLYKHKTAVKKKILILSLIVFVSTISPLIAFDFFHKGSNITTPIRIIKQSSNNKNPDRLENHLRALYQILGRIWYLAPGRSNADEINYGCTSAFSDDFFQTRNPYWQLIDQITTWTNPVPLISLLSLVLLLWFLIKKSRENYPATLLAMALVFFILIFVLFPSDAYEYYLTGFFPLYLFIPGLFISICAKTVDSQSTDEASRKNLSIPRTISSRWFISFLKHKYQIPLMIIISIICLISLHTILTVNPDFGINSEKKLVNEVMQIVKNNPFELKQQGMCHIAEGWRYLFSVYGRSPERSSTDRIFGWIYQTHITEKKVKYIVVINETRVPAKISDTAIVIKEGGFTAYIIDTSKDRFPE